MTVSEEIAAIHSIGQEKSFCSMTGKVKMVPSERHARRTEHIKMLNDKVSDAEFLTTPILPADKAVCHCSNPGILDCI